MIKQILAKRAALEAALKTVNYQIDNLKNLHSREQVRCWYVYRNSLKTKLDGLPTEEQLRADAKRHTALIKQILKR